MDEDKGMDKRNKCTIPGIRYVFVLNGLLGFCTLYALRVNINVAIMAMVNGTAVYNHDNKTISEECEVSPLPFGTNSSSSIPEDGEFLWSPKLQGVILGAFYYGYCISQIPGGRLAETFSGKWVFGIGTGITAFLTLLTPLAAQYHVGLLIAIRALEGLSQGVTRPAMYSMMSKWIPESEKTFLTSIILGGTKVGTVISMPLSGALCRSYWFGGWPSAFYVIGIFGCLWFLLWCFLVTDSPHTHPFISTKELEYITSNKTSDQKSESPPIAWKTIFTSVPFWAFIITQTGQDWCFYTLVNDLPTYFSTILHFDIEKSGSLSSVPHFLQSAVGIPIGFAADIIIRKNIARKSFVRKFCNSVSGFGCVLGLIGVCLSGCDATLNVAFFIYSITIGGFGYSGHVMTPLDMSPEYAGTITGLAYTVSNLTGFLAPLVVGALTEKYQTIHQWRIVFAISSVVLTVATTIFIFFSTTKKQEWTERKPKDVFTSEKQTSKSHNGYKRIQA